MNDNPRAIAVIGGGYGDEGKGLMVDYFTYNSISNASSPFPVIVVRSNGGAQAGHTVKTPGGSRHVFSHFSSGTFNGVPTYLGKRFVVNPILFAKEHKEFVKNFKVFPKIYVHPEAVVTTPYEMLINQSLAQSRGSNKHGSCGTGFGETLERERFGISLTVNMLQNLKMTDLSDIFNNIRRNFIPTRIDGNKTTKIFNDVVSNSELIESYISNIYYFLNHVSVEGYFILSEQDLIFENAQGLLLDQNYGYFPFVTRSDTGLKNITEILTDRSLSLPWPEYDKCFRHDLTVNYVTRAYTTRHGVGPLAYERSMPNWVVDATNKTNEWQDSLRYALLDLDLFHSVTDKDFALYAPRNAKKQTTITCVDQIKSSMGQAARFVRSGEIIDMHVEAVESYVVPEFNYASYGDTRNKVKVVGN